MVYISRSGREKETGLQRIIWDLATSASSRPLLIPLCEYTYILFFCCCLFSASEPLSLFCVKRDLPYWADPGHGQANIGPGLGCVPKRILGQLDATWGSNRILKLIITDQDRGGNKQATWLLENSGKPQMNCRWWKDGPIDWQGRGYTERDRCPIGSMGGNLGELNMWKSKETYR